MNKPDKALFITFEGGEGSGKTTQSKMLYEYLIRKQISTIWTREVGGTQEAEQIREVLLFNELLPLTELLLVMAARNEHLQKSILPALNEGIFVICDRFIDSTACYQGAQPGIGLDKIFHLHHQLMPGTLPQLTFFIDVEPQIALQRAIARGENNKFEALDIAFHQNIYNCFCKLSELYPERIIRIEANDKNPDEIHQDIVSKLSRLLA